MSKQAIIATSLGKITLALDTTNTPKTVENFIAYAESGFYNDTIFHRVIENFMIQGGGLTEDMETKETRLTIDNEAKKASSNLRGTVAMARRGEPHSASSQFFINVVDNPALNFSNESNQGWGYCVFAEVIDGMDVVDAIKISATTARLGHQDVPVEPIFIQGVEILDVATA